jgi:tRNA-splicing ligase RtcB
MSDLSLPPLKTWLAAPLGSDVAEALDRLRRAPDVQQIAVMPDVHLASDVCIGVAVATSHLIYLQAVGGDIGCGMLAVAIDAEADALRNPKVAGQLLAELGRTIPARRRNRNALIDQPEELVSEPLSHVNLESVRKKEGALEFATLGSGNHFLEIQTDEVDRLWLMIHSGSRALGQAIRDHHLTRAQRIEGRFHALDAQSDSGREYLRDAAWARRYAAASRKAIAIETEALLNKTLGAKACWETLIMWRA